MGNKDKLVLFGPPGVGKSTVGQRLIDHGYHYFDGDSYSLPEGVELNLQGKTMTPELRDREYAHIFAHFMEQIEKHKKIVMDYHLMFDRYRLDLRRLDPDLRWVCLMAPFQSLAEEDRYTRPGHLLTDLSFIQTIYEMFEVPSFPVTTIDATLPIVTVVQRVLDF